MSFSVVVSTLGALAVVVGLLLVCARIAARFGRLTGAHATPDGALRVVARLGVAPRQGVAILRVGARGIVVSVGDAGVRTLAELSAAELADIEGAQAAPPPAAEFITAFRDRLNAARKRGSIAAAVVAMLLLATFAPPAAASSAAFAANEITAEEVATEAVAYDDMMQAAPGRVMPADSLAAALLPAMSLAVGNDDSGLRLTGTVGTVIMLGLLATLPTLLLLTTAFTRILIVLHLLRSALGTQNAPPGHLLAALALLLTGFVMAPTLTEVNRVAVAPWVAGTIDEGTMMREAAGPLRAFMLDNTSERDLITFIELSEAPLPDTEADVPMVVLMSAFAISELRAAFQMGFAIFLPFIVIDLVVAAVLTSMGMFMLPPTMIALPCKLMLFVLVDGWGLVVRGLVQSFA